MRVKIETDRALVSSPCLRIITRRWVWFAWWHRRPWFLRMPVEEYRA